MNGHRHNSWAADFNFGNDAGSAPVSMDCTVSPNSGFLRKSILSRVDIFCAPALPALPEAVSLPSSPLRVGGAR